MSAPIDTLRAEVLAQPPADRADYALRLMAYYLDPVPAFFDGCAALGLDLRLRDVRVLHALDKRRGRHVSINALTAARHLDHHCDLWPGPEYVARRISVIRAALAGAGLPVEIKTWRDVGYSLQAPASFRFEVAQ